MKRKPDILEVDFGSINPHTVGVIMRSCVHRAMNEIRKQRFVFKAKAKKVDYKKEADDLVTSADFASQKIYLKILKENFPLAGIVAEEDFACPCTDPNHNYYFTIDPLDGTKAYGRRQSHAIATMISFVFEGVVHGATIGDIMTQEMYHTRPGSFKVYRISDFEIAEQLSVNESLALKNQYLFLRNDIRMYSKAVQKMADPADSKRLFKNLQIIGGSIGFTFSCLWKGELGGLVLEPGFQTPWDICPLIGISKKLGFIALSIKQDGSCSPYEFKVSDKIYKTYSEIFVFHKSRFAEVKKWIEANAKTVKIVAG